MQSRIRRVKISYRWIFRKSTGRSAPASSFATPTPPRRTAGIEEQVLETLGEKVWRVEGQQNALWIAMDYVDVVVHIFQTELREFYKLEELWADAPATRYEYDE